MEVVPPLSDEVSQPRPEGYNPGAFPPFAVTVDVVLLRVEGGELGVLLIQRGKEPYLGGWALPGGFVEPEEDLPAAAARELCEETGMRRESSRLEQLGAYGHPRRDPRMRVVSVAYWAVVERSPWVPKAGDDASKAAWMPLADVMSERVALAFDHRQIVQDAVDRLRAGLDSGTLASRFGVPSALIGELEEAYKAVRTV